MTSWIVILAVGAGSYAMRAVMLVAVATKPLSARYQETMSYVAPAAVAALAASMAFTKSGSVHMLPLAEITALVAAFVAVRHTGKVLHAITVGFPVFWLLSALAG